MSATETRPYRPRVISRGVAARSSMSSCESLGMTAASSVVHPAGQGKGWAVLTRRRVGPPEGLAGGGRRPTKRKTE